jgi:hypothetical protein
MTRAALAGPGEFSTAQVRAMQRGFAPTARVRVRVTKTTKTEIREVSKELHHDQGNRGSPGFDEPMHLREVWPWEHALIDPSRKTGYEFLGFVE